MTRLLRLFWLAGRVEHTSASIEQIEEEEWPRPHLARVQPSDSHSASARSALSGR